MTSAPRDHEQRSSDSAEAGHTLAVRTALVAGIFCTVVCALLLADYDRRRGEDPLQSEAFLLLKAELARRPDDEGLKAATRALDLELREEYFRQRRFARVGTWLLVGGMAVFLASVKSASTLRRKLPSPGPQAARRDTETSTMRIARWSVGVLFVLLLGATVALNMSYRTVLPPVVKLDEPEPDGLAPDLPKPAEVKPAVPQSGPEPAPTDSSDDPTDEETARNWHRFRGPGGLGISAYDNIPTSWDGTSGEGVVWKTPVPLEGLNSPVVWNDRVFLAGGDETQLEVYCFNTADGALLWRKEVSRTASEELDPEYTGFAAPTVTTDGKRVFAMFATGDAAAFDFAGEPLWARALGIPDNSYGHGASPVLYRNLLLIQFDQGGVAKDEKSKLLALDKLTGKTVYEAPRAVPNSWATPCVARVGETDQLITGADPWIIAYNPGDGSEIWRANCPSGDFGPSPVVVDGVVQTGNEYGVWWAIRADGQGDVTETHIAWTAEDGLPDMCSPLVTSDYLFLLATWGALTCFDAKTGELLWEKDFDATFTSSPSWAAGRVYLFADEGNGWTIEPSREEDSVKVIAETNLGEECRTSPAFQDGRFYIRGKEHLFCIGK